MNKLIPLTIAHEVGWHIRAVYKSVHKNCIIYNLMINSLLYINCILNMYFEEQYEVGN